MYEMTPQCLTMTPETVSHCGDVINTTSQRRAVIRVVKEIRVCKMLVKQDAL